MAKTTRVARTSRAATSKKPSPREGEVLPPEVRKQIAVLQTEMTRGPLPPPSMLKAYDEIMPGLAKTIVSQFEKDLQHRRKFEMRGLNFGFAALLLIAILSIGAVILLAWYERSQEIVWIALIPAAVAANSMIKAFTRKDK